MAALVIRVQVVSVVTVATTVLATLVALVTDFASVCLFVCYVNAKASDVFLYIDVTYLVNPGERISLLFNNTD